MAFKATPEFRAIIRKELKRRAEADATFKERLQNKDKSIEECCEYIASQVYAKKVTMISEEEVYGIATHYYDEEKLGDWKKAPHATVVTPKDEDLEVTISAERKAELQQEAEARYLSKQIEALKAKKAKPAKTATKPKTLPFVEQTLF